MFICWSDHLNSFFRHSRSLCKTRHLAARRITPGGKVLHRVGNACWHGRPGARAAVAQHEEIRKYFEVNSTKCEAAEVVQIITVKRLLTVLREAEAPQEPQTVVQPGEQREAAAERVLPEEQLEHGRLLVPAGSPVRVRHCEVVQVGQERRDPASERALRERACVCGRRCHVLQELRCLGLEVNPPSVRPFRQTNACAAPGGQTLPFCRNLAGFT